MKSKTTLACACALFIAVLSWLAISANRSRNPIRTQDSNGGNVKRKPQPGEILRNWPLHKVESILVEIPGLERFRVRPEIIPTITRALVPPVVFEGVPPKFEEINGSIDLIYNDGSRDHIVLYLTGMTRLLFKLNNVYYRRGPIVNPNIRQEHREIYGVDDDIIDESTALKRLLLENSDSVLRSSGQSKGSVENQIPQESGKGSGTVVW